MGSNSSVASLPAYLRMIFWPPGCSRMEQLEDAKNVKVGVLTWQEIGDIVGFAVDNDPARVLGIVLGDSRASQFLGHLDGRLYK